MEQVDQDSKKMPSIVELLQGDSRFSILVTAVKEAGLVEVLSGSTQYTVFAPSNKAFEALPEGTLEALLKPENREQLKSILLYHVAEGSLKAFDVLESKSITTTQGEAVEVDAANAKINSSKIVATDIIASNGVIHEIDAVLIPPAEESSGAEPDGQAQESVSIVEKLAAEPRFSTLVAAVQAAGLVDVLAGSDEFTVFAPSNEAFDALPAGTVETLLKPENKERLKSILLYHVASGSLKAADVLSKSSIQTAQGAALTVDASSAKINASDIIATDFIAKNGVIHEINAVLLPPSN
jgi:uncharacterized surface protein with fasciclin (FAS1) repeats